MNLNENSNTEQLILDVAEKLFMEKGFAMTSTVEIAKEVGCNQALVHYYFRSKARLFDAIFDKKVKIFLAPFFETIDDSISFEESLKRKIEAHFELLKENPRIPFLFFNELLTNSKRLTSLSDKYSELYKSVLSNLSYGLQAEIKKGTIRQMEPLDLIFTLTSMNVVLFLTAPVFQKLWNQSDEDFNKFIENRKKENVLIVLRSIKP